MTRRSQSGIHTLIGGAGALLALLVLTAVGLQLTLHVQASYSVVNFFSYFTNLSNLFAAAVLLLALFWRSGSTRDLARYLATVNMLIVGVVFALLLRDVDLGGLLPWINIVLHYVMPVAIVLDWLLRPPSGKLAAGSLGLALIFPLAYLA